MSPVPPHFRLNTNPTPNSAAVVIADNARFTLLTSRLIRMEIDQFTDRASQVFWHRRTPVPDFKARIEEGTQIIETGELRLAYQIGQPFSKKSLSITFKVDGRVWRYGDKDNGNLRGTTRTLDMISGSVPLEPGLLSRDGWTVVDDSTSLLFQSDGWLHPREGGGLDLYFFGYGHDYQACIADFMKIAGPVSLIPRWALGNWWSRYWAYSQEELQNLMTNFREKEVPLSVCIIDMDWHLTDIGDYQGEIKGVFPGWTGYTWNPALFPDPGAFLNWLHEQGLKTGLNLHPADGVLPHESAYPEMAARLGIDPDSQTAVRFDIANPDFASAYFDVLHHPEEARGVDFWWMDWQQERSTSLPGLDPLWWLNHLHFYDLQREGKRPFIFSRWGGLGNHRYPIGFSGDTFVTWESLAFQPQFTATAANVGYGWWSHDIGGHMLGTEEPELFARWVQFGVFSPIFRLHSTKNPFHERRPWGYDAHVFQVTRQAMQLRHALIPYIYSLAWLETTEHIPFVRPMYHDWPDEESAYECPGQYMFGKGLIAAPFVQPAQMDTRLARQEIWLPEGEWTHFFSGEYFEGNQKVAVYGRLQDIPVFAQAGAIVPLGPKTGWGGVENPIVLDIHLFAGADGRFLLYEDDGETTHYKNGAYALTEIGQHWRGTRLDVIVRPAVGDTSCLPEERIVNFYVHGVLEPDLLDIVVDGSDTGAIITYDEVAETLQCEGIGLPIMSALQMTFATSGPTLRSRRDRTQESILSMLHAFKLESHTKMGISQYLPQAIQNPALLEEFRPNLKETQLKALVDVILRSM